MLLRWIVANWVRQTAQRRIYEAVSEMKQHDASLGAGESQPADGDVPPPVELPPCQVAVVFALGVESDGLANILKDRVTTRCPTFLEHAGWLEGRRVVVAESGVGRKLAARATEDLISVHQPAWVISAGFAGALTPELQRGHMLMADEVVDTHDGRLSIGLKIDCDAAEASRSLHVGRLLTVDELIRTKAAKEELAEQYSAVACDMETLAVAEVCRRAKVRFMSVRIISDALSDELPKEIEHLLNQKSLAGKLGAATGAILNRPSAVKDMWKLKEDALKASDRLARFLVGVVEQLAADEAV